MKSVIIFWCLLLIAEASFGQVKQPAKGKQRQQKQQVKTTPAGKSENISLQNAGAYPAMSETKRQLQISDATVNSLNMRSAGINVEVSSSGVVGMPRSMYGIANGKLLLRSTTAPGIGSTTGSGSVGTGTTIGSIGTAANSVGVNGKSPLAGPAMYGTRPYGLQYNRSQHLADRRQ